MTRDDVREAFLRPTLEFIHQHSRYYCAKYGEKILRISKIKDLTELAPTTKQEFVDNCDDVRTSRAFPDLISISGGADSRGSKGLSRVYHSSEEIALHRKVLESMTPVDGTSALSVMIASVAHGIPIASSMPGTSLLPLEKPFHFRHLLAVLDTVHDFEDFPPRVSRLLGSTTSIKLLVALLNREGIESWPLEAVSVGGGRLTPRWRNLLSSYFQAEIFDVYGISEIAPAVCADCRHCGHFHMPVTVIPEIEDLGVGTALTEDELVGELLLTSLVPSVTVHPFIRYRTGDLVQRTSWCEPSRDYGFRLLGRRSHSLLDSKRGIALFDGAIEDCLDGIPGVRRRRHIASYAFNLDAETGPPIFEVVMDPATGRVQLIVAVNFEPTLFKAQCGITAALIARTLKKHPSSGIVSRDLRFEVVFRSTVHSSDSGQALR